MCLRLRCLRGIASVAGAGVEVVVAGGVSAEVVGRGESALYWRCRNVDVLPLSQHGGPSHRTPPYCRPLNDASPS